MGLNDYPSTYNNIDLELMINWRTIFLA